jgi:formate dehydrogenase maturation protein FdhE
MTKPFGDVLRKYDRRIERARELAGQYSFATEVLAFYSRLAAFQQGLYSHLLSTLGSKTTRLVDTQLSPELNLLEIEALMPRFRPFLSFLEKEGPSAMAGFAARLKESDPDDWARLLKRFWRRNERDRPELGGVTGRLADPARPEMADACSDDSLRRFTALAFLQPYVESIADKSDVPAPAVRRPLCPFCGSKPLVGVLRPEGEGAKRSLVCSFCYTEWDYLRIACPGCAESRDDKMCVYSAARFELVRVDACETCKSYLKTVDLTESGLAIPEVDELAAIPLTLWADEQGYTKISRNVFNS